MATMIMTAFFLFILSLAYLIYVTANKEKGNVRIAGFVLSGLIAFLAVIVLFSVLTFKSDGIVLGGIRDAIFSGRQLKVDMMTELMKKDPTVASDMMKDPAARKIMVEAVRRPVR